MAFLTMKDRLNQKINSWSIRHISQDLIDANTRKWKAELICNTFTEKDAERILCIPLSMNLHEDHIIWRGEPTGEYTVRNGHKYLLYDGQNRLQECSTAKETWEKLNVTWPITEANTDFKDWIKNIFESNSLAKCRMISCALWAIWTSRNRFIHEGEIKSGSQIAYYVINYLKELDGLNMHLPVRWIHKGRWVASNGLTVKINFDVAFNRQRNESCSGIVVQNERAEGICSRTVMHANIPSVFAAEAVACLQALNLGLHLGLREVDSRSVLRKLQEEK
ncbi:reverse transcriptase [Gossypium australe]|uniref:Reverse transcriptase n=1 Tax=Gossypium australe TaxID=47621 RepID=A0A5B6VK24_9ROSI|nr:reverse transcriptase [Gossypium australe]